MLFFVMCPTPQGMYSNIRGLYKNIHDLIAVSRQYDILFCTETLVSSRRHPAEILIPGFKKPTLLRSDAIPRARGMALYFKNTVNLFIHIARIPIGNSPRVHPNILKCLLHSPVAKGYLLVVIASRAMVCKTPTYYLILESLAYARGCVILRSHILILLLLILLIFHHIHS